jgi:hypothetical protein
VIDKLREAGGFNTVSFLEGGGIRERKGISYRHARIGEYSNGCTKNDDGVSGTSSLVV